MTKIVIIGNGVAGITVAKELVESGQSAGESNLLAKASAEAGLRASAFPEIKVYSEEKYPYYSRIDLIKLLAGKIELKEIFFYPPEWYEKRGIKVYLNQKARKIDPVKKEIVIADYAERSADYAEKTVSYDQLVLATGAQAASLPVKGKEKQGVFTLRTIDDVLRIKEYLKRLLAISHQPSAVVIGGGVLGLEAGWALSLLGTKVTVVEFFNRFLPRQLDEEGANIFKTQVEKLGINVLLAKETIEILGNDKVREVVFKGGTKIPADLVLFSAGIRPNIELGQTAGLKVNKGIIVDEHLRTSQTDIYACGDCAGFQGKIYGIIPAAIDQAKIAAQNVLGKNSTYAGTIPSNTLKVVGIDLTSIGLISPDSPEGEEIKKVDKEKGIYKKLILKEGKIVGTVFLGTKTELGKISRLIKEKTDVSRFKETLLE
ncbi:MAG TPA: NAD(P)/FAD-dependent oxidoreductase [Elusimicrobia bacterium]|jgi:nitrite reductase (NADH) large subunit|nr:NAD(P)/FAD-dependent oxidoreductase [Elusimicrobiota bacterium]